MDQKMRILLILGILTACSGLERKIDNKASFDTIKEITIPRTITWTYWFEQINERKAAAKLVNDTTWFEQPIGKLIKSNNYAALLFESKDSTLSCLLVTFDKNKKPVDTLALLGGKAADIPTVYLYEDAKIGTDLTINLYDSIYAWKVDGQKKRIEDTRTTVVKREAYKVLETGEIERLD